jgi:pyruvate dehydrogenase E1 component alpha subunit
MVEMKKEELIEFEKEISELFLDKKIHVPVHLVGGNENQLIRIFKWVKPDDFVLSTHRNHFHALLKGIPKEKLKEIIVDGESMHIYDKERNFFTSSIVGGILPIAVGIAMGIKKKKENRRVFVFVGDMAAHMGIFHECTEYAGRHDLPIIFVVEDNGLSVDSPTEIVWGDVRFKPKIIRYKYKRVWNHVGPGLDGQKIWESF